MTRVRNPRVQKVRGQNLVLISTYIETSYKSFLQLHSYLVSKSLKLKAGSGSMKNDKNPQPQGLKVRGQNLISIYSI